MKVTALRRVGRNVSNLDMAAAFYAGVLGFQSIEPVIEDPALAHCLGAERVRLLRMRLGAQEIDLSECFPKTAAYPGGTHANDLAFQHIAIVTSNIALAYGRVMRQGGEAISRHGPVHLPVSSGNVWAFKFRDPDGHPLELLQFGDTAAATQEPGFDHSAICVSSIPRSVAFYTQLGLTLAAQQLNHGPAQDALDGLANVAVDVLALHPPRPSPHVELLSYRAPKAGLAAPYAPTDICADRLIFGPEDDGLKLLRDPDGHLILLDDKSDQFPP